MSPDGRADAAARRRRSLDRSGPVVLVYLGSRLAVLAGAGLLGLVRPGTTVVRALHRWDGGYYLLTASSGYPSRLQPRAQTNHAFFPMYPLVIRGVHALGLSYPAAAEWSSFVIGAVASVAVWMLAVDVLGDERASRAVLLFVFFPAAFVLSMVYAEGMLLVGGAGCLLLLGRRQWLGAGIAGAVATASRPNGVVVVVCCAWASIVAIRERREWRSLVAPAVAPLGAVGFFAYLWARTGNSTAWFFVERQGWHEHIDGGRASARLALRFVTDPFHDSTTFIVGLAMLVAVLGVVLLVRLRPPAIVMIYTGGILVVSLMSATLSLRPRFVFTAFPLIFAIADAVPRRLFAACVAMSAALMAILFVYYGLGGPVASAP